MSAMPQYNDIINQLVSSISAPSQTNMLAGIFGNNPMVSNFASMTDQANQANATRGQDIIKLLQSQGGATKTANQRAFQQQVGGIDQDMMSKGLANTTVGSTLKQGAQRNLQEENAAVDERSALNIADVANSFSQRAPDLSMLASLMTQANNRPAAKPAYTGAISSSAAGVSRQRSDGMWEDESGALSPYARG